MPYNEKMAGLLSVAERLGLSYAAAVTPRPSPEDSYKKARFINMSGQCARFKSVYAGLAQMNTALAGDTNYYPQYDHLNLYKSGSRVKFNPTVHGWSCLLATGDEVWNYNNFPAGWEEIPCPPRQESNAQIIPSYICAAAAAACGSGSPCDHWDASDPEQCDRELQGLQALTKKETVWCGSAWSDPYPCDEHNPTFEISIIMPGSDGVPVRATGAQQYMQGQYKDVQCECAQAGGTWSWNSVDAIAPTPSGFTKDGIFNPDPWAMSDPRPAYAGGGAVVYEKGQMVRMPFNGGIRYYKPWKGFFAEKCVYAEGGSGPDCVEGGPKEWEGFEAADYARDENDQPVPQYNTPEPPWDYSTWIAKANTVPSGGAYYAWGNGKGVTGAGGILMGPYLDYATIRYMYSGYSGDVYCWEGWIPSESSYGTICSTGVLATGGSERGKVRQTIQSGLLVSPYLEGYEQEPPGTWPDWKSPLPEDSFQSGDNWRGISTIPGGPNDYWENVGDGMLFYGAIKESGAGLAGSVYGVCSGMDWGKVEDDSPLGYGGKSGNVRIFRDTFLNNVIDGGAPTYEIPPRNLG